MKKKLTHRIKNFYEENKTEIQVAVFGALMFAGGMYLGYRKCDFEWAKIKKNYVPLIDKQISLAKLTDGEVLTTNVYTLKEMGQLGADCIKNVSDRVKVDENTKCIGTLMYLDAEIIKEG